MQAHRLFWNVQQLAQNLYLCNFHIHIHYHIHIYTYHMTKVQAHGLFWNVQQLAQHSANGDNLKLEHNYDYRSCQDKMRRRRMTLMMKGRLNMMILRILGLVAYVMDREV